MTYDRLKTNIMKNVISKYRAGLSIPEVLLLRMNLFKEGSVQPLKQTKKEVEDLIYNVIMEWDIRNIQNLIDKYPEGLPKWIVNKQYKVNFTHTWVLERTFNLFDK